MSDRFKGCRIWYLVDVTVIICQSAVHSTTCARSDCLRDLACMTCSFPESCSLGETVNVECTTNKLCFHQVQFTCSLHALYYIRFRVLTWLLLFFAQRSCWKESFRFFGENLFSSGRSISLHLNWLRSRRSSLRGQFVDRRKA